ncbi:uncharacterized protein E0L32_007050 [Thyridium curvatum]|uniref:Uncharacterized protein n=1 Tax=Thyridium curvatum TaxID=1093900 RepID=A0A507B0C3_9PEZI|nr:uncharacterized protein E0L32_007050 [Thyridium curvatum]TPX12164.1 hypothetical protein E0L32_007050 [Thyridium curvatum]
MSVTYLRGRDGPSCGPPNSMPDWAGLPEIPANLTVAATPGRSPQDVPAFNATCWPSEVHVAQGCYLWCEIAQRYYVDGDKSPEHAIDNFRATFGGSQAGMNRTEPRISGYRVAGSGRVEVSAKMLGTWLLVVSGFLMYAA